MPPLSDKELEEMLTAAGNSLSQTALSPDELLPLLDRIEELLSKVEQSPAKSMQAALSPLMKALILERLVKHSDVGVRVGVASCISEITRITAPDAPYDDEKMKDIFQLIVSSFENLSDVSSRSYEKRATILETVAKVRSCVIMLDLECDQMIVEMFQHFFKCIRDYHSEVIFASMETIMTLVIEESEDISANLLNQILAVLEKNNEAVVPVAKKLAERVIQNAADKLKPYLTQVVKSFNTSLDDYSEVVASVCLKNNDMDGHSNESILDDQLVAMDAIEDIHSKEDPFVARSPKSIMSNGVHGTRAVETIIDANSSEVVDSNHQLGAKSMDNAVSDAKLEHTEAQQVLCSHDIPGKDAHTSATEAKTVEAVQSMDEVKETTIQLSPSRAPESEAVNVQLPIQSGSLADKCQSKTDNVDKRKEDLVREEMVCFDTASTVSEGEHAPEAKLHPSGANQADETNNMGKSLTDKAASKNDDRITSDSVLRSLDQTEMLGSASAKKLDTSSLREGPGKKSRHVRHTFGKEVLKSSAKEDHGKDTVTSPRSPSKSRKNEAIREEATIMSSKRKRTPGTEKASHTIEYGENLVGSKVKVWWPIDRMFYEGVIASFDSVKKKHKVLYTDGDKEILNLRRERWEFVGDALVLDGDQNGESSSPVTSFDMQKKKKGNTTSETSTKGRKMEVSPKSKLIRDNATKSGGKSKHDNKVESESNDNSKPSRRSVDDTVRNKDHSRGSAKASGKDDVSKTPRHSKQSSQTAKPKGKTPQRGKTLGGSGTRMTKSASSSKAKETDRAKGKMTGSAKSSKIAKGKSIDTTKSRESETKSGKKQKI